MSLESLLDRVAYTVTSVTSPKTPDVTEKPYIKQRGYVGYVGYVEKNKIQSEKQKTPSSSAVSSSSDSVICKHIVDTLKTADYSFLTFGRYGVTNNHHLDDQDDAAHVSNFAQTFVFSDVTDVTDVTASNGAGCSGYAKKNTEVTGVTVYAAPSGDTYSEWLVTHSTGERAIHCFAPPKSRAEVLALYQGATVEPAPPEPEPTPLPPDAIPLVYAYLNHVGETCPATRTEFVTALERDHRRLAWLYGEVVRMGLAEVAA